MKEIVHAIGILGLVIALGLINLSMAVCSAGEGIERAVRSSRCP